MTSPSPTRHPLATYAYTTTNIGDDFQAYAIEQILGHRTTKVYRDRLYAHRRPVRLVANSWYFVTRTTHTLWARLTGRSLFPPPSCIEPHYIGVAIGKRAEQWMLTPRSIEHFRQHAPIGCRDSHTQQLLQSRGVDAWFSGCPTISMNNSFGRRTSTTYLVDIDRTRPAKRRLGRGAAPRAGNWPDFRSLIPRSLLDGAVELDHFTSLGDDQAGRYQRVEELLRCYATAGLVITTRLHVALPCAAFGTPCLLLHNGDRRFTGYPFLQRLDWEAARKFSWKREDVSLPDVAEMKRRIRESVQNFAAGGSTIQGRRAA